MKHYRLLNNYILFTVTLTLIVCWQAFSGAYSHDVANHPDEAAHFVTGVMVHDYLCTGVLDENPISFAHDYYQQYPKIAIGQWPPLFYAIQAVWYLILGVGQWQAFLLIAFAATVTMFSLFRLLSRLYGADVGAICVVLLFSLPLIQNYSSMFMSEIFVFLFSFLAFSSFCEYLEKERPTGILFFAFWSIAAILTKGTGFWLGLFAVMTPVMVRKPHLYLRREYWFSGGLVVLFVAPYYLLTMQSGMGLHGKANSSQFLTASTQFYERFPVLNQMLKIASPVEFLLAAIAVIFLFCPSRKPKAGVGNSEFYQKEIPPQKLVGMAAFSGFLSFIFFLTMVPLTVESRYYLVSLLPLIILVAYSLASLKLFLSGWEVRQMCFVLVIAVFAIVTTPEGMLRRVSGCGLAAASIPVTEDAEVILVSSDSSGEGAFIAKRLMLDTNRSDYVLRGSKVLSSSSWSGRNYDFHYKSKEEIREFLIKNSVKYIVVAKPCRGQNDHEFHQNMLRLALSDSPDEFPIISTFPLQSGARVWEKGVVIYENKSAAIQDSEALKSLIQQTPNRTFKIN